MYGPTRKQIQRAGGGVIGAAPSGGFAAEPTNLRYKAIKAAKLALDRQAVAEREGYRPRSVGPMKPRSRGDAIRRGNGNGNGNNWGPFNGESHAVAVVPAAPAWWMNPLFWVAVAGLYFVTRKGKK